MYGFARLISITPIVSSSYATLSDEEVFGIVDVLIWAGLDAVQDSGLEVYQDSSRNVSRIVTLVVEDVLAVTAFCCKVLQVAILIDAVFLTQLLPKLAANYAITISNGPVRDVSRESTTWGY